MALAILIAGCLLPAAAAIAADQVDMLDQDGRRDGYIRISPTAPSSPDAALGSRLAAPTMEFFDRDSRRTGYGVTRPDGSVDLFRPDGSRLGTIQPGTGGQPSRIILPRGKR